MNAAIVPTSTLTVTDEVVIRPLQLPVQAPVVTITAGGFPVFNFTHSEMPLSIPGVGGQAVVRVGDASSANGGGAVLRSGVSSIIGVQFSLFVTKATGGTVQVSGGTVEIGACAFIDNSASRGGAIAVSAGAALVLGAPAYTPAANEFRGNETSGNGGAIFNAGTVRMAAGAPQSSFTRNKSTGGQGGAIYSEGSLQVVGAFLSNQSSGSGGAVAVSEGTASLAGSFKYNSTGLGHGGAVYNADGVVTITGAIFDTNVAKGNGGAVATTSSLTVSWSQFSGNFAGTNALPSSGGGIDAWLATGKSMSVTDSYFSLNTAKGEGGGIALRSGNITVSDTTFLFNSASAGGGVYLGEETTATISGGLFRFNSASTVVVVNGKNVFVPNGRAIAVSAGATLTTGGVTFETNWIKLLPANGAANLPAGIHTEDPMTPDIWVDLQTNGGSRYE